jgi:predicted nucleic acid-binding protein
MNAEAWYLDSSAVVRTVIEEPESRALMRWLAGKEWLTACDLARVEVVRAVRVSNPDAVPRARKAVATLTMVRLDDDVFETAANLEPPFLRSLDAIHLAAASSVGSQLAGLVTYDERLAEGARALGLPVVAPGSGARR